MYEHLVCRSGNVPSLSVNIPLSLPFQWFHNGCNFFIDISIALDKLCCTQAVSRWP